MLTLTPKELISLLQNTPDEIDLIDVRNTDEYDEVHLEGARLIPLHILPLRESEIDKTKKIIFICRSGGRSGQACLFLEWDGITAYNLEGGMNAVEKEFPTRVIRK